MMTPLSEADMDKILKESDTPSHTEYTYEVIPRSDTYKDLCNTVIYIVEVFHKKYFLHGNIVESDLKTMFDSSKKILKIAVNLICDGQTDAVFNFAIEMEFNRAVYQNKSINDLELGELMLTKYLVHYIRANDTEAIYCLISYVCSGSLRNKLLSNLNWFDMPI